MNKMQLRATPQNNADQIQLFIYRNRKQFNSDGALNTLITKLINATQHMGDLYPHYPAMLDAVSQSQYISLTPYYSLEIPVVSSKDEFRQVLLDLYQVCTSFCSLSGHPFEEK